MICRHGVDTAFICEKCETRKHIWQVHARLNVVIKNLMDRALCHDASKLDSPEVEIFDKYTPLLKGTTYGSDEYKKYLEEMEIAIDHHHHYPDNSHHPEYYENGIRGMSLCDLIEMLCDWKAATMRHSDGDIMRSIEINQERFGYSDELKQIFINTIENDILS